MNKTALSLWIGVLDLSDIKMFLLPQPFYTGSYIIRWPYDDLNLKTLI